MGVNLRYKIGLTNVWWDKENIDTRYFENLQAQANYFDTKIGADNLSPYLNFNIADNITTSIAYQDVSNRTTEELIACNYAVLYKFDENNQIIDRRYFFAKVSQLSGRQMRVDLDLDDIQTNYFKHKDKITPCTINRAHLNRFVKNSDNLSVSFNLNSDSHLFEIEGTDLAKRLIKRDKLNFNYYEYADLTNWLKENLLYWVYIFIDKRHRYKAKKFSDDTDGVVDGINTIIDYGGISGINSQYGVISYPVLAFGKKMYVQVNNKKYVVNKTSETYFENLNSDTSYYYTSKMSIRTPAELFYNYEIDENGDLILKSNGGGTNTLANVGEILAINLGNNQVIFTHDMGKSDIEKETQTYILDYDFNFNITDLKGTRNSKFNPKLLNSNFKTLSLRTGDGNIFNYDIQKLGAKNLKFLYDETLQPEITKYYFRVKSPTGLYVVENNENYNGLVGSVDNALAITNSTYASFIANNKNFWLQTTLNVGKNMFNFGENLAQGNVSNVLDVGYKTVNSFLTIDNMRNAPSDMKNANGNVLFNQQVAKLGLYIEIYSALEHDIKQADDAMYKNGFAYGEIGKVGDFDNIRKYFNYISADIETITANISNEEKSRLRGKISEGVRFWNSDTIQYNLENYERFLDEN